MLAGGLRARRAWTPRTVGYIEAHGTGTALGDPIEIDGLQARVRGSCTGGRARRRRWRRCGLGSVKTNIGHLELAAGMAGVIKVLLQLQHRTLVQTLHCEELNPYIHLERQPVLRGAGGGTGGAAGRAARCRAGGCELVRLRRGQCARRAGGVCARRRRRRGRRGR